MSPPLTVLSPWSSAFTRGRWVDHRLGWAVGWTSIPQLSLALNFNNFSQFLILYWESWWQSHQSRAGFFWEGAKGLSVPTHSTAGFWSWWHLRRYWQGMQGTQWDLTQSSYFCGPLFSGFPVDLSVTSQKEPLTDRNSSLVLAEEEGKSSEI